MSYPRDLDEIDESKLERELNRRKDERAHGKCGYCGRAVGVQPACKFPKRHAGEANEDEDE